MPVPKPSGLAALALRFRTLVFLAIGLLVAGGVLDVLNLPVESVPDISPREVLVTIIAPGLAPEDVERLVTFPIETQMTGLPEVRDLRSVSRFGVSVVYVEFADDTDIYLDRTMVDERLQAARAMISAPGIAPSIGPLSTGLGEIMQFQLADERKAAAGDPQKSLMELHTIMQWQVAPQLKQVKGVVDLNINGGDEATYEVRVDASALVRYGIPVGDIFRAVDANNSAAGGAWIEHNQEQQVVLGNGLIGSLDDLGRIVLRTGADGVPILIRDVAQVRMAPRVRLGAVTRDGQGEIVNAVVLMLTGSNSGVVGAAARAKLQAIQRTLPKGIVIKPFYDRTDLTRRTIRTVEENLLFGAFLVVAVLLVVLVDLKAALVIGSVIPLALLLAMIGMHHLGISANLMSLGAIDFGMIVDGSVVLVENVLRRRSGPAGSQTGSGEQPGRRAVIGEAAAEVARPICFAIAIIVIVYLPVLSLQSIEGKMFRPMAFTVILALLASLLLSLTWMPAIASVVLPKHPKRTNRESWLIRTLRRPYQPALGWCEAHPWPTAGAALVLVIVAAVLARGLGGEFIPKLAEGSLVVTSERLPSVALPTSIADTTLIERTLRNFPRSRRW